MFQANNLAVATALDRATDDQQGLSAAAQFWTGQPLIYVDAAMTQSAQVAAWAVKTGFDGAEADEAAKAKRAQLVADALSTASSLPFVPDIPNEWVKMTVDKVKDQTLDTIKTTPKDAEAEFKELDQLARNTLEWNTLDLLLRAGHLDPDVAPEVLQARDVTLHVPPEGAIERVDGQAVRLKRDTEEFQTWYQRTPVRSELISSMVNTYASAWGSIP